MLGCVVTVSVGLRGAWFVGWCLSPSPRVRPTQIYALEDHIEKLMTHLKHEAAAKAKAMEASKRARKEVEDLQSRNAALSKRGAGREQLITELKVRARGIALACCVFLCYFCYFPGAAPKEALPQGCAVCALPCACVHLERVCGCLHCVCLHPTFACGSLPLDYVQEGTRILEDQLRLMDEKYAAVACCPTHTQLPRCISPHFLPKQ